MILPLEKEDSQDPQKTSQSTGNANSIATSSTTTVVGGTHKTSQSGTSIKVTVAKMKHR